MKKGYTPPPQGPGRGLLGGSTTIRVAQPSGGHLALRVKTPLAEGDPLVCANGRPVSDFYNTQLGQPYQEPKTCLGCGAKQQPDGTLPCGH
jgi:hypothetical protein